MTAVAAPALKAWTPNPSATTTLASLAPPAAIPMSARPRGEDSDPNAELVAGFVARHYRVARDSARDMVHAAYREGRRNDIDPLLILAVIAVESRFNPIAESEQGAVGLMQIVPRFHMDKVATGDAPSFLLPHANIAIGARILKDSIRRGGGEIAGSAALQRLVRRRDARVCQSRAGRAAPPRGRAAARAQPRLTRTGATRPAARGSGGSGMNSRSSCTGSFIRPARQSAFACSMRSRDEETKFHST